MMETKEVMQDSPSQTLVQLERENTSKVFEILQNLYGIWNSVGVDDEQQVSRATQVWGYVFDVLKDIVNEETELYEDIKERIRNYQKKISELLVELQLPQGEEIIGTLIVKEETLRQQLDKLSKIKHKRVKEFQELHAQEMRLCKILGMPPLDLSSTTGVPTEQDIYELKQHMFMLQEEKENRQKKYFKLKKELTTIVEVTELTPDTSLEKQILSQKEDTLSLSSETLKLIEEILTKTKDKQAEMENEKVVLLDKLAMLWDVLKIDEKEKELFLSKHTDCRVSSLNAIKEEIARCEKIKRDNISKYVDALKEELISLWEKCYISWTPNMLPRMDDDIDESVLESYDNEVKKWWKYYKDTEHIFKKIKERQEHWDQMVVFENKAADPNRFKNRGGNLLVEERQRKTLQKVLPKLEEKIMIDIKDYEEQSGKPFLYFGEKFEDFMKKQWEERNNQKENEKLTRQKMRTNLTINEKTRLTPGKRPFVGSTPKSAPSKLFKSSVGMSVFRSPNPAALRQLPNTVSRIKNNRIQSSSAKKADRSVLKQKNEKSSASGTLDSTTYTDFAVNLERSSRIAHRSSVLSSRKIVGTRISVNKSKRKSVNKATRKSLRRKVEASKLTPAGGKLGLPFLI